MPGASHSSTFHSFCGSVLRRHIDRLGYGRDFSIYDEDDQVRVVKACIEELGLGEQISSPRGAGENQLHQEPRMFSGGTYGAADPETQRLASLYELYESRLRRAHALDFDDLLLKTVDLFYQSSEVCERYNQRFRYIQVDEYQDTNRIQYQLIRQLTLPSAESLRGGGTQANLFIAGAAPTSRISSTSKRTIPGAKVIRLEQNYRSTQIILDAAGAVVSRNLARKGKTLWTDRSQRRKAPPYSRPAAPMRKPNSWPAKWRGR